MPAITVLTKQGCFDNDIESAINANFANLNAVLGGSSTTPGTGIPSSALSPTLVQYISIPLTLANLQTTNSVPVPILPAQGAGTLIEVMSAVLDLIYGSAAFTGGGATGLYLGADSTGVLASAAAAATVFTTFTASHAILLAGAMAVSASTAILNKGLVLANPTADFAAGTGATGILKLAYRVHSGLS